jgi:general secretion pathway protein K
MSKNNSGIILLTVLWTLAILSLLALSLSKSSSLDLALIRNSVGKVKAYAAARAGINYVQTLLFKNKTEIDSLYQCGIKITETQTPEKLFKTIQFDQGVHFDIVIPGADYGLKDIKKMAYGLEDEQAKINLNSIDANNYPILSQLLQQFGVSETEADDIAVAVLDWHSDTTEPFKGITGSSKGAKDNHYSQLSTPYKCKNRPFDHIEELFLVRGMTQEIFMKIKNHITVFPKNPVQGFKINFNTASDAVLNAVVEGILAKQGGEDIAKALITLRNGSDRLPFTIDDGIRDVSNLSASQQLYVNSLKSNYGINVSEYFRVRAVGRDESTKAQCMISAVIKRPLTEGDVSIVEWHRE